MIPVNDKKEFKNINDILDSIEDEALYEYLKDEEPSWLNSGYYSLKIQVFNKGNIKINKYANQVQFIENRKN